MATQSTDTATKRDAFGNAVDPVGYARGSVLSSSIAEAKRLQAGQRIAAGKVAERGANSIAVFTGNQRDFPLQPGDLSTLAEEWVGPSLYADALREVAIAHLGGRPDDAVAVFNRTSAGIVATILAHAKNGSVVSVVPNGARSHASVVRGSWLARAALQEVEAGADWAGVIAEVRPDLVIVTTVTSSLERMDDDITRAVVDAGRDAGAVTFLDEAYGARLRPVLHGGALGLTLGADIAVTNCDKAGLSGPRAGVLVGRPEHVTASIAAGSELGMEARAPIAAAAMRSLQEYDPEHLRAEAAAGQELAAQLGGLLGDVVSTSDLGPMVHEDDVHRIVHERAGVDPAASRFVPAETATVVGMLLLQQSGILTVNTHGQPGARVSLRLKPTLDAIRRAGGIDQIITAVDAALNGASDLLHTPDRFADLITGGK
jgi:L-seryl-tRNA(Ser) seleniumtransferase